VSLAFSAVVLFLIFVPGVVFFRSYFSEPFSKSYIKSTFADQIGFALIPALVLQLLMLCVVEATTSYRIDFRTLGILMVGAHEESAQAAAFVNLERHLAAIVGYNLVLWTAAAALGHLARWIVITFEFDTKLALLRFDNEWYYFLTGREWGLRGGADFDFVWLDALSSTGSGTVLYSGILQDFGMSNKGSLDWICLSEAEKRSDDSMATAAAIPGKGLILQYDRILNLNVAFYFATERDLARDVVADNG
jgi:hypothetical protein